MRVRPFVVSSLTALGATLLAGCADHALTSAVAPSAKTSAPTAAVTAAAPVCEVIDLANFSHGSFITALSLPTQGLALTVSATAYLTGGSVAGQARAFDTDHVSSAANDGTDFEWNGAFARCPDCEGLGRAMIVQRPGTGDVVESLYGGRLKLVGFPADGGYYVKSFVALDNDGNEPATQMLVDGVVVGSAVATSDGNVQTIATATTPITGMVEVEFGRPVVNGLFGSGAVDNIEICRAPAGTGCTRTIGYWKTHAGFGPQADVVTQYLPLWLGTPGGTQSIEVTTAAQAVSLLSMTGGASNGIVKLYAQLLGAKLNLAAGATPGSIGATIAAADAFLATHDASAWSSLSSGQRSLVLGWMTAADAYNNSNHCD